LRYGVGILLRRDAVDTVTVCAYLFKGKFAVRFSLHRCRLLLLSVQSVFYWFSTGGPKGKVVVWHIRAGGSGHGAPPKACKSRSGVAYPRWRFWSWCPTQGLSPPAPLPTWRLRPPAAMTVSPVQGFRQPVDHRLRALVWCRYSVGYYCWRALGGYRGLGFYYWFLLGISVSVLFRGATCYFDSAVRINLVVRCGWSSPA